MQVRVVPVTPFVQNSCVVTCSETNRGAILDPGGDVATILAAVRQVGCAVDKVLVTHAHIDHVGAVAEVAELLGVPIEGPELGDRGWIEALPQQGRMFGLPPVRSFTPNRWLADGDRVEVGNLTFEVLHCPGHTPGHIALFSRKDRIAFVGDVLFAGSIGRTDLPGGDYAQLLHSITTKLLPLGDDVMFYSGHGPDSTIGQERRTNPFLTR
ncbi:MAG: MBL fold metallo-hydrolase [Candidatus Schekmanbacteria bacterium]|nr:MBL fold metallo-hydrolase [Candidatus Schekmanbacteria bacterium]